jgi:hypothetical protein
VVRNPSPGQVLLYAATSRGILRYQGTNPYATSSSAQEWDQIKTGDAFDVLVSPDDNDLVYASMFQQGLYRTTTGQTATGDAAWDHLNSTLPDLSGNVGLSARFTLDMHEDNADILYAAAVRPDPSTYFAIYRSDNGGDDWYVIKSYTESQANGMWSLYNPYIRVHPANANVVYFGGQKLYKGTWTPPGTFTHTMVVKAVWDHKTFEFDPHDATHETYYALCDQGIFRGTVHTAGDTYIHRNSNLRVTQFFDVDCSSADSGVMVGGTQDTGTLLLYPDAAPNWRMIRGSDGYHSLITRHAPGQPDSLIVWSQVQFMDSTAMSAGNLETVGSSWAAAAATGLPTGYMQSAYITRHPTNHNVLLSQGDQVYATLNGGASAWSARGPDKMHDGKSGNITRVIVRPDSGNDLWIAGTSTGELWSAPGPGGVGNWTMIFSRPESPEWIVSMALAPTDSRVLYVVFGGGHTGKRVARLEYDEGQSLWSFDYINDNLPSTLAPLVVAGDGHRADVAHVGTAHGVWRWDRTRDPRFRWQSYNDGLPLTQVSDLLVDPTSLELRAGTLARGAWSVATGP